MIGQHGSCELAIRLFVALILTVLLPDVLSLLTTAQFVLEIS
jgi:hypothetical protein